MKINSLYKLCSKTKEILKHLIDGIRIAVHKLNLQTVFTTQWEMKCKFHLVNRASETMRISKCTQIEYMTMMFPFRYIPSSLFPFITWDKYFIPYNSYVIWYKNAKSYYIALKEIIFQVIVLRKLMNHYF